MIIRVAYNNQGWKAKCKNVRYDEMLYKCRQRILNTQFKLGKNGNCVGTCDESKLCREYYWINYSGDNFNKTRANGKVYFVYPDKDNSLVLWGESKVKSVKGYRIYFEPFEPWPRDKWISKIKAKEILGKPWGSGTFRYLNDKQEERLINLIRKRDDKINNVGKGKISQHLKSIFNAITTKPFIILSGISGTGKTQIARIISAGLIKDDR
ncbi:MAG: hypothetical protein ABIK33_03985 [candidate division WOR-3 bacterium]